MWQNVVAVRDDKTARDFDLSWVWLRHFTDFGSKQPCLYYTVLVKNC